VPWWEMKQEQSILLKSAETFSSDVEHLHRRFKPLCSSSRARSKESAPYVTVTCSRKHTTLYVITTTLKTRPINATHLRYPGGSMLGYLGRNIHIYRRLVT
jgi:hypothetical protein